MPDIQTTIADADLITWRSARSLRDLGQLMAQWIEGDLASRPGYYGPSDLDTPGLSTLCASLCREGFITDNSQSGGTWHDEGDLVLARESIAGYCNTDTLVHLRSALAATNIHITAYRRVRWWHRSSTDNLLFSRTPVTLVNDAPYTWFGGRLNLEWLGLTWEGVSRRAWRAVRRSWHVALADQEWGREGHLSEVLTTRFLQRPVPAVIAGHPAAGK